MITDSTVLVLGAGASVPYGFPTGEELRGIICNNFVDKYSMILKKNRLTQADFDENIRLAEEFTTVFQKSSCSSIDLFLSRNPEFESIGKIAIVFYILMAERSSRFREESAKDQDWYSYLFSRMTENIVKKDQLDDFSKNNMSIITFNYDRSLEQFMFESLTNSFRGVSRQDIINKVIDIEIIHLYGQAARFDWQKDEGETGSEPDFVYYGEDVLDLNINYITRNIQTIFEAAENPRLKKARELIACTHRIFFLGFGFAEENLGVLNLPDITYEGQNIHGTAYGMFSEEIYRIANFFYGRPNNGGKSAIRKKDVILSSVGSLELLRKYL